ncbi:hypothetical protein QCA50_003438 [Cerrena zonata]|uniref:F-box domain-containing protein n=1 Tax=Cerrena zonata TaxID=2478898 RepID=A0AAW0GWC5_9APHY
MSNPVLSQELLDYILDFLCGDLPTLRTCSLTSRCLLDASYHHLFETVTVSGDNKLHRMLELNRNGSSVTARIRNLEIKPIQSSILLPFSLDNLQEIINVCPSLQNLRLISLKIVYSESHTPPVQEIVPGRQLHYAYMFNCNFAENVHITFPGLLQILRTASLSVYGGMCPIFTPVEEVHQCLPDQCPLTDIILDHVSPQLLRTLNAVIPRNTIVELNLVPKDDFDNDSDLRLISSLGAVIAKHSSSLRSPGISPYDWHGLRSATEQTPWSLLNITSASKLSYFYVQIGRNPSLASDETAWEVYLSLIALLPDSIERISITIMPFFSNRTVTSPLPSPTGAI